MIRAVGSGAMNFPPGGRSGLIACSRMRHAGRPAAEQCEGCTFSTSQVGELGSLH